jgi:hypothetical protein
MISVSHGPRAGRLEKALPAQGRNNLVEQAGRVTSSYCSGNANIILNLNFPICNDRGAVTRIEAG